MTTALWVRTAQVVTVLTLAWGVLAFGAVYSWAFWPLSVSAGLAGVLGLVASRRVARDASVSATLLCSVAALVAVAMVAQLAPLSMDALEQWSPATVRTLRQLDLSVASDAVVAHPLSIQPTATVEALALFIGAIVLLIGVARVTSTVGVGWLARFITALGVLVALIGIIQKPLFTGKIYGFWQPEEAGSVFGPFVNRNHFAGWMMMALPVTLGLLAAGIDRGMQGVKPVWRERLLWVGSKAASQLIALGTAAGVMALSLVLTFSRSGIGAFGLAVLITGLFVSVGVGGAARKAVGTIYLVGLFVLVLGWAGMDRVADVFAQSNWQEYGDRRGAWADARRIASMFPWTGTGIGTYGVATTLYQQHDLTQHYEQAHNDYLELAAEGGALVAVPAVVLIVVIGALIVARFRDTGGSLTSWWVRAGAVTGLLAVGLQEIVDFSLQMPGNAMMCAVLIGMALHRAPKPLDRATTAARRRTA